MAGRYDKPGRYAAARSLRGPSRYDRSAVAPAAARAGLPRAGGLSYRSQTTPAAILGPLLHTWLRAGSAADFVLSGSDVTTWINRTGNGNPTQSSTPLKPASSANGFNGGPCVVGDSAWRLTTAITPLRAGSRPYIWAVASLATIGAVQKALITLLGGAFAFDVFVAQSTGVFQTRIRCSDGTDNINGPALDTGRHLFEIGWLPTTVGKYRVDGVPFNGIRTGGLIEDVHTLTLGDTADAWDGATPELVIALDMPSAAQLATMYEYFVAQPYALGAAPPPGGDPGQLDFSNPDNSAYIVAA